MNNLFVKINVIFIVSDNQLVIVQIRKKKFQKRNGFQ
jgi:archaellum biogenesis protein FlaJ (TadC family)